MSFISCVYCVVCTVIDRSSVALFFTISQEAEVRLVISKKAWLDQCTTDLNYSRVHNIYVTYHISPNECPSAH